MYLLDPTEDQDAATKAYVDNVGRNGFNLTCSVYEEALCNSHFLDYSQSQFSINLLVPLILAMKHLNYGEMEV